MENLRPHEIAEQLQQSGYEIVNDRVESARLGQTIDRGDCVSEYLQAGKFEQNEYGYVGLTAKGDPNSDGEGSRLHAVDVQFVDPLGRRIPLGGIYRINSYDVKATAYATNSDGTPERLLPDDPRWDAIVGTVERAVDQSWKQKFGGQS